MKFPLTVSVFLLTVSSSLCADITVSGTEGGRVNITCPYPEGIMNKYSYKYFYKGTYINRVIILQSDGLTTFEMSGRFSMQVNYQTRSFTVTISNLRMEDAGLYGCKAGYENDNPKEVELIVIEDPESTRSVQISTSTIRPYTDTSTEHTSTVLSSDLAFVAGGLGSVLLAMILYSVTCLILKKRKRKSRTALFQDNLQHNTESDRMNEEIPNTDFTTGTSSSNQTPASHLNNQTEFSTVYPTVTNQQPDSNPSHTHLTNQVTDTAGVYYADIKSPESTQDSRTELIYITATHPQNITTNEDPIEAPRFLIN